MRPNSGNPAMNAGGGYSHPRHNPNNGGSHSQGNRGDRGGGRRNPGMLNRSLESNGPEGKVRGTALQLHERYKTLAREHQASDRVLSETYGQFAEHYYRLAAEYGAFEVDANQRPDSFDRTPRQPGGEMAGGDVGGDDTGTELSSAPMLENTAEADAEDTDAPSSPDRGPQRSADRFSQDRSPPRQDRTTPRPGLDAGVLRTLGALEPAAPAQQPSLLDGLAAAPAAKAPEPADEAENEPEIQKRRRGRPRKEAAASEAAPEADSEATREAVADTPPADGEAPRRRGRPRKTPEAASA
jgi:hypothetical protein